MTKDERRGSHDLRVRALGQAASGHLDVETIIVGCEVTLPWLLATICRVFAGGVQGIGRTSADQTEADRVVASILAMGKQNHGLPRTNCEKIFQQLKACW